MMLEKNGDGRVVKSRGFVGAGKTGERDGGMRLGDGRATLDEKGVGSR